MVKIGIIGGSGLEDPKILKGAKRVLKNPLLKSIVLEVPDGFKRKECENILSENGFKLAWSEKEKTRNEIWSR